MAIVAEAAQPADYYKSCEGKSGEALLKQLNSVVGSHTNVGYDGLWNVYKTSDVDANGKIGTCTLPSAGTPAKSAATTPR